MTEEEYFANLRAAKELYHHGVKGQQWGERNGPPYPLDEKGQEKLAKQIKTAYSKSKEKADKVVDKKLTKGAKKYVIDNVKNKISDFEDVEGEYAEIISDYKDLRSFYASTAAIMDSEANNQTSLGDITLNAFLYVNDDQDSSSFDIYLKDTNNIDKAKKLKTRGEEIRKQYYDAIDEYVDQVLGEYGNQKVENTSVGYNNTVKSEAKSYILSNKTNKVFSSVIRPYMFYDSALDESKWSNKKVDELSKATKFVSAVESKGFDLESFSNGWAKLNDAINILGFEDIPYYKITDTMWDQIDETILSMSYQ